MNNKKVLYTKPISLFRVITNSTFNTIGFILLIIFSFQYFYMIALWLETLLFQILIIFGMIIFTITEYKQSFFLVDEDSIQFYRPSNPKKMINISLKNIYGISVESSSVVIYDLNKKRHALIYISKPNEVKKDLDELLKKNLKI